MRTLPDYSCYRFKSNYHEISNRLVSSGPAALSPRTNTMQRNTVGYLWSLYEQYLIQCTAPYNVLLVQQSWIKYSVSKLSVCDSTKLNNSHRTSPQNFTTFFRAPAPLSPVRLLLKIKNASLVRRCPLPRESADNREMYSRQLSVLFSACYFSLRSFASVGSQKFPASKEKAQELWQVL